jgi:predicted nucleic acid-binding protein
MYLVDTDVLSAASPTKRKARETLAAWMDENSDRLFISTITVAEIEAGIAKTRREEAHRKAAHLSDWLETLLHIYGSRVLPFDLDAARLAGGLSDLARSRGHAPGFADIAIAGIAAAHRLTVLTGNTRYFAHFGVPIRNPFEELP